MNFDLAENIRVGRCSNLITAVLVKELSLFEGVDAGDAKEVGDFGEVFGVF